MTWEPHDHDVIEAMRHGMSIAPGFDSALLGKLEWEHRFAEPLLIERDGTLVLNGCRCGQ